MDIILQKKFPKVIVKIIIAYKNEIEKTELFIKIFKTLKDTIEKDIKYGIIMNDSYYFYYKSLNSNIFIFIIILLNGYICKSKNQYYLNKYNLILNYLKLDYINNETKAITSITLYYDILSMKNCILFFNKIKKLCNNFKFRCKVLYYHKPYFNLKLVEKHMVNCFLD